MSFFFRCIIMITSIKRITYLRIIRNNTCNAGFAIFSALSFAPRFNESHMFFCFRDMILICTTNKNETCIHSLCCYFFLSCLINMSRYCCYWPLWFPSLWAKFRVGFCVERCISPKNSKKKNNKKYNTQLFNNCQHDDI